ncbi:guanylate-binding protein 1 isoform X2 [Bombina bombina]|uniref:guanylate-binding protein 1 isoform X2 n=1 Tax=Bombina bombina TaxID=8345 RepID=UPI00235A8EF5|nr:guanylate-binding protein 1 isoform X2 [Bombina bombina]
MSRGEASVNVQSVFNIVQFQSVCGGRHTGIDYKWCTNVSVGQGFALGSTIQSKTKGIWMWCVDHPSKPGHTLVLLDTEGLGDVEKGDSKNDAWIFCLAVLMSSNFVFNSFGTIDQQSVDQLHYVTELTKRIRLTSSSKGEDETSEFKRIFPSFTWCVRDFTLMLERDGKNVTEDEYLMNALKLKNGSNKTTMDYNMPRECILHFFHSHKCFVFDRPASRKNLHRLEELEESELEEDFVEQAGKFCAFMHKEGHVKTLPGGILVTGRLLGNLTDSYVKAIQSGSIPCMENAVLALAELENMGAVKDALSKYDSEMSKYVKTFPTETNEEFLNMHRECEVKALEVFMARSFMDENQKYQTELKKLIDKKMKEFTECNMKASEDLCRALIEEFSKTLETGISTGECFTPGGHTLYLLEKMNLLEEYNLYSGKGIKALEVLQNYLDDKRAVEDAILFADQTLTEKEKQIAEEQAKAEASKREKEIIEENNRRLQQCCEDQKRSFQQNEKMLKEKMEEQERKMRQENERLIQQKLQEQQAMLNGGFQDKFNALQGEIAQLRAPRKSGCVVS